MVMTETTSFRCIAYDCQIQLTTTTLIAVDLLMIDVAIYIKFLLSSFPPPFDVDGGKECLFLASTNLEMPAITRYAAIPYATNDTESETSRHNLSNESKARFITFSIEGESDGSVMFRA